MNNKIEFCVGSVSGNAIYLTDDSGGIRVLGTKCYGSIRTKQSFALTKEKIDNLIEHLIDVKKEMANEG